ncbi:phosphotransferase family protein [Legionella waltersii]|uniref:Choline kinase n=1 Tax=Legionella waltersii TaxID=66969 RepID=A0A0W1ANW1_9GAMM|nr:phosphotransferase family protein [Legionella waltersii]KTD83020.1 choline kinase [Legionella waltersii]SNV07677.1 choline kinase [Legionella waltersii]
MKIKFFGENHAKPTLSEHLVIYILSLLDNASLARAGAVNSEWRKYSQLTKKYVELLPTVHRIPFLQSLGMDVLRFKLLSGGMTNSSYRVKDRTLKKEWVLRVPGRGSSAFINRGDEKNNAIQASQLGVNVPIDFYDSSDGLQLAQFIKDAKALDQSLLAREGILQKIASMMKTMHGSSKFVNNVDFFGRNAQLLQNLKEKGFKFPGDTRFIEDKMHQLQQLFSNYEIPSVPCHNDTTPGNFLVKQGATPEEVMLYQIDWEYSSNNDLLWDLVYFCVEAKLSSEAELAFINCYFSDASKNESLKAWLAAYKPIIEWWIAVWSWTQVVNEADAVDIKAYETLGKERYLNTIKHLQSNDFIKAVERIESESQSTLFRGARVL